MNQTVFALFASEQASMFSIDGLFSVVIIFGMMYLMIRSMHKKEHLNRNKTTRKSR